MANGRQKGRGGRSRGFQQIKTTANGRAGTGSDQQNASAAVHLRAASKKKVANEALKKGSGLPSWSPSRHRTRTTYRPPVAAPPPIHASPHLHQTSNDVAPPFGRPPVVVMWKGSRRALPISSPFFFLSLVVRRHLLAKRAKTGLIFYGGGRYILLTARGSHQLMQKKADRRALPLHRGLGSRIPRGGFAREKGAFAVVLGSAP